MSFFLIFFLFCLIFLILRSSLMQPVYHASCFYRSFWQDFSAASLRVLWRSLAVLTRNSGVLLRLSRHRFGWYAFRHHQERRHLTTGEARYLQPGNLLA